MDIIISANNREEVFIFPVVPNAGISTEQAQNNSVFEALDGPIKVIGKPGLRSVSLDVLFPVDKNYSWVRPGSHSNGWDYIDFFKRVREQAIPVRLILTGKDESEMLNMPATIDSLSYETDRVGDIHASLSLGEYRLLR